MRFSSATGRKAGAPSSGKAAVLLVLAHMGTAFCAVSLGAGCSGDLGSASPDDETPTVNDPVGSAGATGGGGSPSGGAPPVVGTPEPSDWFSAVQAADCSTTAESRTRIRRLSTPQFGNTVQAALGVTANVAALPSDSISSDTHFNTDAVANKVNVLLANAYFDLAEALAPTAATAVMAAYPCLSAQAADPACSSPFIAEYGRRLFRRPLAVDETSRYTTFLTEQAALDTADVAVGSVLRAMLLSPNTLFITELGSSAAGSVTLTPYEQAQLISYLVADAPPDPALWQAAEQGTLADPAQRALQAERLLQTPAARAKYADFWSQYLPVGDLRQATDVEPTLVASIEAETARHFENVVWEQGGSFAQLLTEQSSYGDANLSEVYGNLTPDGAGRFSLPTGERSGFVTQAAFLFSSPDSSEAHKVIQRGLVVRERLLCQPPTPPPPTLMPDPAALAPLGEDATAYESYQAFSSNMPGCAGCHNGFHPIGLAFESYDDLGRYRETYDDGGAIITSGELANAGDANGPYANAVELAMRVGNSQIGEYCFSRKYAEYALGRHLHATVDACTIRALGDTSPDSAITDLAVILSGLETGTGRYHTVVTQ